MELRGLDAYITGGHYHRSEEEIVCPKCNHHWTILLETEYGMTSYIDEDQAGRCPECGYNTD